MSDFKEKNRLKLKKNVYQAIEVEGSDFENIVKTGEVTESYRFTEDEGVEIKKDIQTLLSERLDGMPGDDALELKSADAKKLEKQNKKYSDKDRKDSVKLAKSIRKDKMKDLANEYEKKKASYAKKGKTLTCLEEISFKEKMINLDTQAAEAFIKAYAIMNDKEKVDLAMNKMRNLYRKIGVYMEYLRDENHLLLEQKLKIEGLVASAKDKLTEYLNDPKIVDSPYFSWKKIGPESMKVEPAAPAAPQLEVQAAEEEQHNEEQQERHVEEQQEQHAEERQEVPAAAEEEKKEKVALINFSWKDEFDEKLDGRLGDEQKKKNLGEWVVKDHKEAVKAWFLKQNAMTDKQFLAMLIDVNNTIIGNRGDLRTLCCGKELDELTLEFSGLQDKLVDSILSGSGSSICDKKVFKDLTADTVKERYKADFEVYKKRKEKLENDRDLALDKRGEDIWKSKAMQALVIEGHLEDEVKMRDLKKQILLTDKAINGIIAKNGMILMRDKLKKRLMAFLGDQALFGNLKNVKNLTDQYLSMLSLYDPLIAKLQKDFDRAYKKTVKGAFSESFEVASQQYLTQFNDLETDKDRRENLADRLERVAKFEEAFSNKSEDRLYTAEEWKKLVSEGRKYISSKLKTYLVKTDEKGAEAEVKAAINEIFERCDKQFEKDRKKISGVIPYMSCKEYLNGTDVTADKTSTDHKGEDINAIPTYVDMLKGDDLLGDKELQQMLKLNKEEVEFLRDNLSEIISKSEELREALPFMNDIKGIGQLDKLTQVQYEKLRDHLKENLCNEAVKNVISGLERKEGLKLDLDSARRNILLRAFSTRQDAEGIKKVVDEEKYAVKQSFDGQKTRLMIRLGMETTFKESANYGFNEIPETRAGGEVITKRRRNMKRAEKAWQKIEELGPEAVEQMRRWIQSVIGAKNTRGVIRNRNAKCFVAFLSGIKILPSDSWIKRKFGFSGINIEKNIAPEYQVDPALKAAYEKRCKERDQKNGINGKVYDLGDDIKEIFAHAFDAGGFIDALEGGAKETEVNEKCEYGIELLLCGAQDVLLGPGGKLIDGFFSKSNDDYKTAIEQYARFAIERMEQLDKDLEGYPEEVRKLMKKKLRKSYLIAHDDPKSLMEKKTEEVKRLQEEIDSRQKILDENSKKRAKEAEDRKKKEEDALKAEKERIKAIEQSIKATDVIVEKANNAKDAAEKKAAEVKKDEKVLKAELKKKAEKRIAELKKKEAAAESELEAIKKECKEKKDVVDDHKKKLKSKKEKAQDKKKELANKQKALKEKQADLEKKNKAAKKPSQKDLKKLNDSISSITEAIKKLEEEAKQADDDIATLSDRLKKADDELKKVRADRDKKAEEKNRLTADRKSVKVEKTEAEQKVEDAVNELNAAKAEKQRLNKELEDARKAIDDAVTEREAKEAARKKEDEDNELYEKAAAEEANELDTIRINKLQEEIGELGKKKAEADMGNYKLIGASSLSAVQKALNDNVSKEGVMSKELLKIVSLYKERMDKLENYEGGELKSLSSQFFNNDTILGALMDPAVSVADKMIERLYEKFKDLALVLGGRPEHLKRLFLEDRLDGILKSDKNESKDYWSKEVDGFEERYFSQMNGQKGSVNKNIENGENILKKWIEKNSKTFKDSKNAFASFKGMVRWALVSDPDLMTELYTQNGAETLYTNITTNYNQNYALVEDAFYMQMLLREEGEKIRAEENDDDDIVRIGNASVNKNEIKEFKNNFIKKHGEQAANKALNEFRKEMATSVLTKTHDELKAEIGQRADNFIAEYMQKGFKPEVLKIESELERLEHENNKKKARAEADKARTEGEKAYDKLLYGDGPNGAQLATRIAELSGVGYSLAYREFDHNQRPKSEKATKNLLDNAYAVLKEKRNGVKVPAILNECLAEYKILQKKIDAGKDNAVEAEAERLWKIHEYGTGDGEVPEKAQELFTVYMARFWTDDNEESLKKLTKNFKNYYVSINDLQSVKPRDPVLANEHAVFCEKMTLLLFEKGEDLKLASLNAKIKNQKQYFIHAEKVFAIMKQALDEHELTRNSDELYKDMYMKGLSQYLRADIIKNRADEPDAEAIKAKIKAVMDDRYLRSAVSNTDVAVSSVDFYEKNSYPGSVKLRDFERKIRDMAAEQGEEDLIAEYNSLSVEQRQMFAVALYSARQEETGSQRVIYGVKEDELKAIRGKFKDYIKGKEVEFEADYGKSLRKLISKTAATKEHMSVTMFKEALNFVKKVEQKKEELRPKEWDRIDDAKTSIETARNGLLAESSIKDNKLIDSPPANINDFVKTLGQIAKDDIARQKGRGFFTKLGEGFGARRWAKGLSIDNLMESLNSLKPYQMRMLVYVLQNRSALDFSSSGKDEESKMYTYANKKRRFALIEELTDESKNMYALSDADSEEMVSKAMLSLLSYQIKDHEALTEDRLTADDYAEGALSRYELLDWKLLYHALDLVNEIDTERLRMRTVQQASQYFVEDAEKTAANKRDAAQKAYIQKKDTVEETQESFEKFIMDMAEQDKYTNGGDKDLIEALMSGYMALTEKEKVLFVRALEHRDILDISQRNLYKNFLGTEDRDYVNAQGRDELIDEYMGNASGPEGRVALKKDSYGNAFVSLLSTQINDDMDFSSADQINWAGKKITVDNQLLVFKRKTAMDWKLFARALQFVTRASNETQMASGDNELYRTTGDVSKHGRMSFDRSFLRSNLHRTGGRLARFLASQALDVAKEKLGWLDTLADLSEFVVNEEVSNFLHDTVSPFVKEKEEGDDDDEDDDDDDGDDGNEAVEEKEKEAGEGGGEAAEGAEEEKEKEPAAAVPLNEEEKKKAEEEDKKKKEDEKKKEEEEKLEAERKKESKFLKNMSTLSGTYSNHKDEIIKISGNLKTVYKDVGKELFKEWFGKESDREVAEKDKLSEKLEGVEVEGEKKIENVFDAVETAFDKVDEILDKPGEILGRLSTEDFGLVGTIYKYASMGTGYAMMGKEYLDKYLRDSPEMLETIDNAIKNYLGGFVSTKAIGEWYTDKIDGNINKGIHIILDERIPENVRNFISGLCDKVKASEDLLGKISKYIDPATGILVAFKGIYDNAMNISKLKKVKNEALENRQEDEKKLDEGKRLRNKEQEEQVHKHKALNVALLQAANDTTQYEQYREIMGNVSEIVGKVGDILTTVDEKMSIVGLGIDTAVTVFQKAIDCASFIMHCINDKKMLKDWFNGAGRDIAERMESGKNIYAEKSSVKVGPALEEQIAVQDNKEEQKDMLPTLLENIRADKRGKVKVYDSGDVKFTRRAMGFESNEELNCYMALNMVHALLFSASDYNTLKEPRLLAKVTMTVLGFEDSIGKTDSETAMGIYKKLRQ